MAEGGALLRRYTDKIRIEGSNPSLSASDPLPSREGHLNRFVRRVVATCTLAALASFPAFAQFPASAVTLVVAAPAGDEADVSARLIAAKLTERWGRAVRGAIRVESALLRSDARVAEGGALLRRYTGKTRIEGSNPSHSATFFT